jgi:hypothetical protein
VSESLRGIHSRRILHIRSLVQVQPAGLWPFTLPKEARVLPWA